MAVRIQRVRVANPNRRRRMRLKVGRNRLGRFVKAKAKNSRKRSRVKNRQRSVRRTKVRSAVRRVRRVRRVKAKNPGSRRRITRRRRRVVNTTPKRRRRVARRRIRKSNPLLIELGALNPRRERRKKVATKRRRSSRRRRVVNTRRRRRSNPVAHTRRRRISRRHRVTNGRRRYSRRRTSRNPMGMSSSDMMVTLAGGLAGMALTKFLPTMVPATITNGNMFMAIAVSAAGAYAAGMVAEKMAGPRWGKAVMVGGLIQTGSLALNSIAPSLASSLGVSGMGDIIPSAPFPVPNNNLRPMLMVSAPSQGGGVSGVGAGIRRQRR